MNKPKRAAEDLRRKYGRSVAGAVIRCIFIPFYNLFWFYDAARKTDKLTKGTGKREIATIAMIIELFTTLVSPILIQSRINDYERALADRAAVNARSSLAPFGTAKVTVTPAGGNNTSSPDGEIN